MRGPDFDDIREIQREQRRMWAEIYQRPIKVKGGGGSVQHVYQLVIIGGNLLSDGITEGIKYSSSPIVDVPAIYDPEVDTSFVDGIGRGYLYIDGVLQTLRVLILHDSSAGAITTALFSGDLCIANVSPTTLPLDSDPSQTVTLWRPLTP